MSYTKTMDIIMLPAKQSLLAFVGNNIDGKKLYFKRNTLFEEFISGDLSYDDIEPQNLYVVSDTELKENDWYLVPHNIEGEILSNRMVLAQATKNFMLNYYIKEKKNWWRKVEATTDASLHFKKEKYGVAGSGFDKDYLIPSIPQSFIEDFVRAKGDIKNISVELEMVKENESFAIPIQYKIKTDINNTIVIHNNKTYTREDLYKAFCAGADFDASSINTKEYYLFTEWFDKTFN